MHVVKLPAEQQQLNVCRGAQLLHGRRSYRYRWYRRTLRTTLVGCSEAGAAHGFSPPVLEAQDASGMLPPPPDLKGLDPQQRWNAAALAFMGDCVYELYVRRHYFFPPRKLGVYCESVQSRVRAESQSTFYELLKSGTFLTGPEKEIMRWGHNARTSIPKRFMASGKHREIYIDATAFECLAGYLYLTDPPRLHALMNYLGLGSPEASTLKSMVEGMRS